MEEVEKIVQQLQLENDKRQASDPLTQSSVGVVEKFLKKHKVLCYGGTAINNLLPSKDRFYNPETDIPDYDFFSKTPQEHAMMIANKLKDAGIKTVEVKPGMHLGTFKVFADYSGIADVTQLDDVVFDRLWEQSIVLEKIHYVPPNFLRMSMYLELSRPRGDVSRWTKVFGRLQLLNKHYPMECPVNKLKHELASDAEIERVVRLLKTEDVVLLSATAAEVHLHKRWTLPIGLLATKETIEKLTRGKKTFIQEATDILPTMHIVEDEGIRFYETSACHSYHKTRDGVKVASIPTILQFFFAYIYSNLSEENMASILCIAQRLVELANTKPKRRFALLTPIDCIGTQETLIDMRKHKSVLYEKLSKNKNSADFLRYFFTYDPSAPTTQRKKLRTLLRKTRKVKS